MPKTKTKCHKTKSYAQRDYAIGHRNDLVAKSGLMNVSIYYCKEHRAYHVGRKRIPLAAAATYRRRVRA